jgi:hypothetical protein
MGSNVRNDPGDQPSDQWARLDAFLQTNPRDAGCDATMEMLDVYAELLAAGEDPSGRFPGLYAHLAACERCAQDLEGVLAALAHASRPGPRPAPTVPMRPDRKPPAR